MWNQTEEGRQFIEDVSRQVVQQVADDEMDYFDELVAEHYQDPSPPDPKDTELGSGFEIFAAAVTPAAVAAATAVTIHVIKEVSSSFQEASSPYIRERIQQLFSREKKKASEQEKDTPKGEEGASTPEPEKTTDAKPEAQANGAKPSPKTPDPETPPVSAEPQAAKPHAPPPPPPPEPLQPLSQEQLEFLKKVARREARRYGLEADMARNLANALIAAFALA